MWAYILDVLFWADFARKCSAKACPHAAQFGGNDPDEALNRPRILQKLLLSLEKPAPDVWVSLQNGGKVVVRLGNWVLASLSVCLSAACLYVCLHVRV